MNSKSDDTLRFLALSEAIKKFDLLENIMDAASQFYNFLTGDQEPATNKNEENLPDFLTLPDGDNGEKETAPPYEIDIGHVSENEAKAQANSAIGNLKTFETDNAIPLIPLTKRQAETLDLVLALYSEGATITQSSLGEALERNPITARDLLKKMMGKGYIREERISPRQVHYHPVRNTDGTAIKFQEIDGKRIEITDCPNGFAFGYGENEPVRPCPKQGIYS